MKVLIKYKDWSMGCRRHTIRNRIGLYQAIKKDTGSWAFKIRAQDARLLVVNVDDEPLAEICFRGRVEELNDLVSAT